MICPIKILQNLRFERSFFTLRDPSPLDLVYKMPVEIENGIKSAVFTTRLHDAGRIWKFCWQNFVSVGKTAKFVILSFSSSAGMA